MTGIDAVSFRKLTRADFPLLATWLAYPHVARWWNHDPSEVERDFGPSLDGDDPTDADLAIVEGRPVGLVLSYLYVDHPDYLAEMRAVVDTPDGAWGIDYLIGWPDMVGRGVGRAVIGAFTRLLWQRHPAATCVIVPVNSANVASWTALLRAGYRLVGRAEMEPDTPVDGPMHEILRIDRPG